METVFFILIGKGINICWYLLSHIKLIGFLPSGYVFFSLDLCHFIPCAQHISLNVIKFLIVMLLLVKCTHWLKNCCKNCCGSNSDNGCCNRKSGRINAFTSNLFQITFGFLLLLLLPLSFFIWIDYESAPKAI